LRLDRITLRCGQQGIGIQIQRREDRAQTFGLLNVPAVSPVGLHHGQGGAGHLFLRQSAGHALRQQAIDRKLLRKTERHFVKAGPQLKVGQHVTAFGGHRCRHPVARRLECASQQEGSPLHNGARTLRKALHLGRGKIGVWAGAVEKELDGLCHEASILGTTWPRREHEGHAGWVWGGECARRNPDEQATAHEFCCAAPPASGTLTAVTESTDLHDVLLRDQG